MDVENEKALRRTTSFGFALYCILTTKSEPGVHCKSATRRKFSAPSHNKTFLNSEKVSLKEKAKKASSIPVGGAWMWFKEKSVTRRVERDRKCSQPPVPSDLGETAAHNRGGHCMAPQISFVDKPILKTRELHRESLSKGRTDTIHHFRSGIALG